MDMMNSMSISASGLAAQSLRMQVAAENIANADSVISPNGGPYQRQILTFETVLDRQTGGYKVKASAPKPDTESSPKLVYEPGHPYADAQGYVQMPNVDTLKEGVDMREAARLYEANLQAMEAAKQMAVRSLDMLR